MANGQQETTLEIGCPKCGGRTWDNRLTKRNPKAPDFKCRDRGCDGVIWPDSPLIAAAESAQQELGVPAARTAPTPRAATPPAQSPGPVTQATDPRVARIRAVQWALDEASKIAPSHPAFRDLEVTAGDIVAIAGLLLK